MGIDRIHLINAQFSIPNSHPRGHRFVPKNHTICDLGTNFWFAEFRYWGTKGTDLGATGVPDDETLPDGIERRYVRVATRMPPRTVAMGKSLWRPVRVFW